MKVTAVVQRSGARWAVHVPEVPGALTQARTLDQVPTMAAAAVALVLDVDETTIEVDVEAL